ncbi:MAG: hypothetical protein PHX49_05560 [Bacteroidales bacterium]|jgi:hypothetical protein|nr:hypothetical protein [Bacteroidales bacterium]
MKRIYIALFYLLSVIQMQAQEKKMNNFWGLDYSMNKETVYQFVKEKNENKGLSVTNGTTQIVVDNVLLDGERYRYVLLDFYHDKLLAGFFSKKIKENEEATLTFLRIRESLTTKYGEPTVETDETVTCYWHDKSRNIVQLSLSKSGSSYSIGLLYLNGQLNSRKTVDEQMGLK